MIKWKLLYNQISIDRYLQRKHVLEKYCHGVVDQSIRIYGSSGAINTCKHYTYNTGRLVHKLHSILLTQIILETLGDINVPRAPQGNKFVYRANAKETMMWDLNQKNGKLIRELEEKTGVNLDNYHKLNIINS